MITITAHGPALQVLDELAALLASTRTEAPADWAAPVYSDKAIEDMERLAAEVAAQAETIKALEAKLAAKRSRAKKADDPGPWPTDLQPGETRPPAAGPSPIIVNDEPVTVTAEHVYGEVHTPEHLLPMEFATLPPATLTPDELVIVFLEDGSTPEARIVRRFGGTDRYEVQVLKDGAGMAVVEATHIRAAEGHAATVEDHDDPPVTQDQRQELRDWVTARGISFATVAEVLRERFGVGTSEGLRVSQLEEVRRELLKHSITVPF